MDVASAALPWLTWPPNHMVRNTVGACQFNHVTLSTEAASTLLRAGTIARNWMLCAARNT